MQLGGDIGQIQARVEMRVTQAGKSQSNYLITKQSKGNSDHKSGSKKQLLCCFDSRSSADPCQEKSSKNKWGFRSKSWLINQGNYSADQAQDIFNKRRSQGLWIPDPNSPTDEKCALVWVMVEMNMELTGRMSTAGVLSASADLDAEALESFTKA